MRRTVYQSVGENTLSAQSAIDEGNIYQLGSKLSTVDQDNFDDFMLLLNYLLGRGVEVEIYLPSWYPCIYDYFESSGRYSGVFEVEDKVRELGTKYGIKIHGSYDPELGNVKENDFADWLHLKPEKTIDNYNVILE